MSAKLARFILTENLNRLAKWIRLLGYDAVLYKSISFHNLKRIAAKDRRIILTRDRKHLIYAETDKIILIKSTEHLKQLKEIEDVLVLREELFFTRCILCNKLLYAISGAKIKHLVPEYIYKNHSNFKVCRKCGRIYWRGTHYQKMLKTVKEVFNN
ncbi:MAG: hypothetical protein APR54_08905 [Candidatus Cloacimonas sp. SDB]|nr:MAG: hypothetical protein APR54_08905 [Candidatus Cloacimonas sp. SDB]